MNNEQILENWNLQFKDQKKLNIEETKKLIELANIADDEELKKDYFNQAILGTQHVIYDYLKSSKLYLLSSREIGTEDIIATVYEVWMEHIKYTDLKDKKNFDSIINNKKFSNEVIKKLGVKESLQRTRKKSDMYECNNTALFLSNKDLTEYFIKYYTAINAGKNEEEVLNELNISDDAKKSILTFFEKISNYIENSTDKQELSPKNIRNYIEMIITNTIANDFLSNEILNVDYRYEDNVIYKEFNKKMDFALGSLTERENKVIKYLYGIDGEQLTHDNVGKLFNVSKIRILQIEAKALRKLRHPFRSRELKDYRDIPYKH